MWSWLPLILLVIVYALVVFFEWKKGRCLEKRDMR